jgi:hypothetical protein
MLKHVCMLKRTRGGAAHVAAPRDRGQLPALCVVKDAPSSSAASAVMRSAYGPVPLAVRCSTTGPAGSACSATAASSGCRRDASGSMATENMATGTTGSASPAYTEHVQRCCGCTVILPDAVHNANADMLLQLCMAGRRMAQHFTNYSAAQQQEGKTLACWSDTLMLAEPCAADAAPALPSGAAALGSCAQPPEAGPPASASSGTDAGA